jgi:hypothetical protein
MGKPVLVVGMCLVVIPALCQSPSQYQVSNNIYVVRFTPPLGENTGKYAAGRDLLALLGKKTIIYNDVLGRSMEVLIESQTPATKPNSLSRQQPLWRKHMRLVVSRNHMAAYVGRHPAWRVLAVLICYTLTASAQNGTPREDTSAPFSVRATHLMGFENAKSNCNGTLSIQKDAVQFQPGGKAVAEVKIDSVQDVFLGGESKQVGGLPMTVGKAAAPFGGGRVVSLFAHKKYDTLTLEYLDTNGGIHGAIFQLGKGQGELVKNELSNRGVSVTSHQDMIVKQSSAEVRHENK